MDIGIGDPEYLQTADPMDYAPKIIAKRTSMSFERHFFMPIFQTLLLYLVINAGPFYSFCSLEVNKNPGCVRSEIAFIIPSQDPLI
jgi:hypothetical protein